MIGASDCKINLNELECKQMLCKWYKTWWTVNDDYDDYDDYRLWNMINTLTI